MLAKNILDQFLADRAQIITASRKTSDLGNTLIGNDFGMEEERAEIQLLSVGVVFVTKR